MAEDDATRKTAPAPKREASVIGRTFQYGGVGAIVLLAVFLLQNLQDAEVNFLWWQWTVRMVWALLASAVFGALGSMVAYVIVGRMRRPRSRG